MTHHSHLDLLSRRLLRLRPYALVLPLQAPERIFSVRAWGKTPGGLMGGSFTWDFMRYNILVNPYLIGGLELYIISNYVWMYIMDYGLSSIDISYIYNNVIGGLEHVYVRFHILGILIPTDFHIFQRVWNHQPVYIYIHRIHTWENYKDLTSMRRWLLFPSHWDQVPCDLILGSFLSPWFGIVLGKTQAYICTITVCLHLYAFIRMIYVYIHRIYIPYYAATFVVCAVLEDMFCFHYWGIHV
jgi:hypothetical protein